MRIKTQVAALASTLAIFFILPPSSFSLSVPPLAAAPVRRLRMQATRCANNQVLFMKKVCFTKRDRVTMCEEVSALSDASVLRRQLKRFPSHRR